MERAARLALRVAFDGAVVSDTESFRGRGYISTEKTIWCGVCFEWDQMSAGGHVKAWKRRGWKLTKKHGWVCPACSKKGSDA